MENCLFCKIVNKEIPASVIYEDDLTLVFSDIKPKAATHLLIVPKRHISSVSDMLETDISLMGNLIFIAKKVADMFELDGYTLQFNVGRSAGQEIFHVHLHLISLSKPKIIT